MLLSGPAGESRSHPKEGLEVKADRPKQMPILGGQWTINRLRPKQRRFVEEYLIEFNGTKAAIRAGYSAKTAREIAAENLTKPLIQMAISEEVEKRGKRCELTADRVLLEISRLAFADIRGAFDEHGRLKPVRDLDDDLAPAVAAVEVSVGFTDITKKIKSKKIKSDITKKIKLWDKGSALERLGRHLGLFVERTEHTGKGGGPIEMALVNMTDAEINERFESLAKEIAGAEAVGGNPAAQQAS
jgi:phage terminase small subunit